MNEERQEKLDKLAKELDLSLDLQEMYNFEVHANANRKLKNEELDEIKNRLKDIYNRDFDYKGEGEISDYPQKTNKKIFYDFKPL